MFTDEYDPGLERKLLVSSQKGRSRLKIRELANMSIEAKEESASKKNRGGEIEGL